MSTNFVINTTAMKNNPPGSHEAVQRGCKCPVIDNHYGRGRRGDGQAWGWYVYATCPLHAEQPGAT